MRKTLYLLLVLVFGGLSEGLAQSYLFAYRQNAGNPGGLNTQSDTDQTGWVNIAPAPVSANVWSSVQAIPFPFQFFGAPVTHFKASQNLVLTFDTAAVALPGANTPLPSAGLPDLSIAAYWDEFTNAPPTGTNDFVQTRVFGAAPNRQLWIRWFSFEVGNPNVSFVYNSIVLEETSNRIFIVDMYSATTPTPILTATVGLQLNGTTAVEAGSNLSLAGNGATNTDNDFWEFVPASGPDDMVAFKLQSTSPVLVGCADAAAPVFFTVANFGSSTATNFSVSYSINGGPFTTPDLIAGPVTPLDTFRHTFSTPANLSLPGTYTLTAVVSITGDSNPANDTLTTTFTITGGQSLPIGPLDFTGFTGANLGTLYPGWRESNLRPNPGFADINSVWVNRDFGNTPGPNGTSIAFNIYTINRFGWFLSPRINVGPDTYLEFDAAQTTFSGTNPAVFGADDSLVIYVSTDCGLTFTQVQIYESGFSFPTTGQREIISLGAFAGQDIVIGFYASSGPVATGDYWVMIDNLSIRDLPGTDVIADGIVLSPAVAANCGSPAEPLTINMRNGGLSPVSNVSVSYSINGGAFSTPEIVPGPIATLGTLAYTFSTPIDLSAAGTYTITVVATAANDADASNDTASASALTVAPLALPVGPVNFDGFTGANIATVFPGWRESNLRVSPGPGLGNINSNWTSRNFGNVAGPNGNSIAFNITGTASVGWVISPKFEVAANSQLEFDLAQTATGTSTNPGTFGADDSLVVYISTDCGYTYTELLFFGNGQSLSTTGQRVIIPLGAYAGQDAIIGFYASPGTVSQTAHWVYLDNIEMRNVFQSDVQPLRLRSSVTVNGGCGSAAEPLTVVVQNRGALPASGILVSYAINGGAFSAPETIPGPVASDDSVVYTFSTPIDLSSAGVYNVTVVATLANDENTSNDTLTSVFTITDPVALPIGPLDFTGFTGANLGTLYPGWRESNLRPNPGFTNIDAFWVSRNFGNTTTAGPNGTSIAFNIYTINRFGWFLSPKFTVEPNSQLEFDAAQTTFSGTNPATFGSDDSLVVYISTDCGLTYQVLALYGSGFSFPTTGTQVTLSLAAYAGQDVIIGFYASSGPTSTGDYWVMIDNLFIRRVFQQDVTPVAVLGIESGCSLPAAQPVTVSYRNLGQQTLTDLTATYSVNGGAFITPEVFTTNLPSNGLDTLTFATPADLSAPGLYTLRVVVSSQTEENAANDTLTFRVVSQPVIASFPYFTDFETDGGLWVAGGVNSSWAWGSPNKATINSAASGANAWVVGGIAPGTTYNNNESSALVSPCFDMSNAPAGLWVALKIWWESEFSWDGAVLQYTTDGLTWTNVGAFNDPFNWYNDNSIDGNPGGQQVGWTGANADFTPRGSGSWRQALAPLPASLLGQSNVRFRFAFGSDGSVVREGLAFDDFGIGVPPVVSLGPDSLNYCLGATLDAGNMGAASFAWSTGDSTQTISLTNNTGSPLLNEKISVTVTDALGLFGTDTILVNIAAMDATVDGTVLLNVRCFDESNGEAFATAMGNGTLSYLWSSTPPQTTQAATGLPAGTYSVTVTDDFGCSASDTVSITQPDALALTGATITEPLCFGDSTGAIAITVGGGTLPYSYLWSNGDTTQNLAGLPAGGYQGVITDANGCVLASDTVTLVYPAAISVALDSIVDSDCFNGATGGIFISVSGGTGAYAYLWSNSDTTQNLTALAPGDYTGTITDANGCELVSPVLTVGYNDTLPTPSFTFVVGGGRVEFTNTSVNGLSFAWDFGDGQGTSTDPDPVYVYAVNDTFVVTLVVTNGCGPATFTDTIFMETVSIDRELASRISVFPNPTNGKVRVDFDRVAASDLLIRVINLQGQLVTTLNPVASGTFSQEIDLTHVAEGAYLIQVIADGRIATKQVIRN